MAASILSAVLGSVHAFSIFLAPLEAAFAAPRASVSLTYSLALVSLTAAVLFGHRIYDRWRPETFVFLIAVAAAFGAVIAGLAPSLAIVWLGYGLLFGGANGLGYGFALQIAAQANAGREGVAMGIVTAAYALGAVISPPPFAAALGFGGHQPAMLGLAAALVAMGGASAVLISSTGVRFQAPSSDAPTRLPPFASMALLWLGYGAGVAGGLMAIGHAAGIVGATGEDGAGWLAPVVIAVCNLAGSLIAGRLIDVMPPARLLVGLPLISAAALFAVAGVGSFVTTLICLGMVGFAYGGVIAAYPAAISKLFGLLPGPRIYGIVFTAWGAAGLAAPWFAGFLYDLDGAYFIALATAGALGCVSSLASALFFRRQ